MSGGTFLVFRAVIEPVVRYNRRDDPHQGHDEFLWIDFLFIGLSFPQGIFVDIGKKPFEAQGKNCRRPNCRRNHHHIHQPGGKEMSMNDPIPFRCKIEQACNQTQHDEDHRRNSQKNRQFFWIVNRLCHCFGGSIFGNRISTNSGQHICRFGRTGAACGAVPAVVAEPNVCIPHQFIFQSPGRSNHLLPGEWLVIRGDGAGHGTGGTLIAFLQVLPAQRTDLTNKTQIRFEYLYISHILPPRH